MTAVKGLGTYGNGVGVVTPLDHKLDQAGLLVKTTTPLLIRPGLFYPGTATIIVGKANMSYDVVAFNCASQRSAGAGVVLGGNDGTLNVVTTAAPGSNSRWDVLYQWHREYSLDGVDSNPVIGVIQGSAAAIPTVPSLAAFPGAIELGRVLVPSGVVATNSGTTITQTAPFTTVDGGTVPFRNTTEMDLWTTALVGQLALDLATGAVRRRSGSMWVPVGGPHCALRKSANQNLGTSAAALSWDVEISDPYGMHDNVTNNSRIILNEPGLYEVTANAYNNNTSGMGTLYARLNGTTDIPGSLDRDTADSVAALPLRVTFPVVSTAPTDYIEIMVLHSTAAGNIAGGTTQGSATVTVKRIGAST